MSTAACGNRFKVSCIPFPDQGLGALGVDLDQVEARPVGAQAVEGDRWGLHRAAAVGVGPTFQRTRGVVAIVQQELDLLLIAPADHFLTYLHLLAAAVEG